MYCCFCTAVSLVLDRHVHEIGRGQGEGYTINVPLPPGSGSGAYRAAFDRVVVPALDAFCPQVGPMPLRNPCYAAVLGTRLRNRLLYARPLDLHCRLVSVSLLRS